MRAVQKPQRGLPLWNVNLRQVSGATIVLAFVGILGRGITVLTHMVIASRFGLSVASDAFFAAENIPELCMDSLTFGLCTVFIPLYAGRKALGSAEKVNWFTSSFYIFSAAISSIISLIVFAGAPIIVHVMFPGFSTEAGELTSRLFRIMSGCIFFFGTSGGLRGLLHSSKDFITPEIAVLGYNVTLLIFAAAFGGLVGVEALAWGVVAGAVLNCVILLTGTMWQGVFRLPHKYDPAIGQQVAKTLLLFVFALAGIKITLVLDRVAASGLPEGSLTALNYAARIALVPIGIFAIPLRTTIYPDMSQQAAENNHGQIAASILSSLRVLLYVVIPVGACMAALNIPIIHLLFERGAFDSLATQITGQALVCYVCGIPAIATVFVLNSAYLSLGKSTLLIRLNLLSWTTNFILNLILSRWLDHRGIALATSLTVTMSANLMLYYLRRSQLPDLRVGALLFSVLKIVILSVMTAGLLAFLYRISCLIIGDTGIITCLAKLACLMSLGAAFYLGIGYLFRFEELSTLVSAIRKFLTRRQDASLT